jgi:hypothetical protein
MQEVNRYGVDVDFCPSCKGVWLDRGEIDKVASMVEDASDKERYPRYRQRQDDDDSDDYPDRGNRRRKRGFLGELFDFD